MKCLRHPKTTQELRENTAPENKKFIRGKRRKRNLPNAWDDIPINGIGKKLGWKKLRKKQYKEKK